MSQADITDAMIERTRSFALATPGVKFDLIELPADGFDYRIPMLTWRSKRKLVIAVCDTLEKAERAIKRAKRERITV